jgi:nucleotide-binding universal stress UspA family protein
MVAFDGSEGAIAALEVAADVVRDTSGELLIVHAFNPSADATNVYAASQRDALDTLVSREREALEGRAAALGAVQTAVRVELLERGEDVWRGLLRVAEEWGADMIAIASRRAAGLRGMLVGSVTTAVLQHSAIPVLVVRA